MFDHLAPAMRRALDAVRASDPFEATRILQDALGGGTKKKMIRSASTGLCSNASEVGADMFPKRGLSATLAALRYGGHASQLRRKRQPVLPDGSAFLRRSITTTSGARDYRLFVPSTTTPVGIVVMLHGCKQSAEDFAIGTTMNLVAEAEGMLVAYPSQALSANAMGCWNWFRPEDQQRDKGEPHIVAEITRSVMAEYGLSSRVYIAGLSVGGAMAAVMGATYPEIYEAIGIHSGLPYRSASDVNSALAAMRGTHPHSSSLSDGWPLSPATRQIIFHGSHDQTVVPENAKRLVRSIQRTRPSAEVLQRQFISGSRVVNLTEIVEDDGSTCGEAWLVDGAGHHWIGGDPAGSFTKADGPNASHEIMRFFLGRRLRE